MVQKNVTINNFSFNLNSRGIDIKIRLNDYNSTKIKAYIIDFEVRNQIHQFIVVKKKKKNQIQR